MFESIVEIGTAAVLGSIARRPTATAADEDATSSMVPHPPQSGHRPTHLATSCEHSAHRYSDFTLATRAA
ncbi:hypothetical protein NSERUTF1_7278 [Nocardia seriolae]|nr:hypothetical protein NSERUTF1_7278 [Nocardia seriolae]